MRWTGCRDRDIHTIFQAVLRRQDDEQRKTGVKDSAASSRPDLTTGLPKPPGSGSG
jgi:hypothetical protein